jgi:hypothetical protein
MTLSSMLARYLYYEPSQITNSFIGELLEEGIKPNDIIVFAVKFMSKYALTSNLWILLQCKLFLQELSKIKIAKVKDKTCSRYAKLCMGLFGVLSCCDKAQYKFVDEGDSSKTFAHDINVYLTSDRSSIWDDVLINFKDVLKEDIYDLLNILQKCLQNVVGENPELSLRKSFIIVRYFLTLKPKSIFKRNSNGCKLDITDIVFITCLLHTQCHFCSTDLATYVSIAKDIFYFKASRKDKNERVNMLFYVIYTIITKSVSNIPFDSIGIEFVERKLLEDETSLDDKASSASAKEINQKDTSTTNSKAKPKHHTESDDIELKCKLLYFYSDYDEHVGLQIKFEKERLQLLERIEQAARLRHVNVAWNIENEKSFVCVSKLQGRDM